MKGGLDDGMPHERCLVIRHRVVVLAKLLGRLVWMPGLERCTADLLRIVKERCEVRHGERWFGGTSRTGPGYIITVCRNPTVIYYIYLYQVISIRYHTMLDSDLDSVPLGHRTIQYQDRTARYHMHTSHTHMVPSRRSGTACMRDPLHYITH